ncbi:DNA-binding winged helix-turn-helix (wHTH) protein/tetratricopeptide (TPR) repeat protein/energy-coupling factor transporter ATP-binding protein EcfA2 [Actimicrobium sp. GrIS 1.19]|uniref:nSTAND1 domain-containing NTPase n=1 Tax=Actimicrobium sp. GrIS 1.19 TaxID=3071708 RepID=UPI002DFC38F8|nr:DNA-binding winged helix-turn-helix (wHTH) protein/tetratricopeptide (TPR) repeat protein/energy-coupling factor transporter ATP-binding protein EcfA2 [Actimicrobium sp. GrIS 1.19]
MDEALFRFGDWQVSPSTNSLRRGAERLQMEPRAMDVLVALCERAGVVVSVDELLQLCWGSTLYGDNPVHKTVAQLRRLLVDSATAPVYIETIRKRGYRAIAAVEFGSAVASWPAESPFRGLEAFDARHAPVFFGRGEATAQLAQAVVAQLLTARALVLVLGPSGSGKTSLIRAGLLPMLETGGVAGLVVRSETTLDLGEPGPGQLFTELGGALLDWQIDGAGLFDGHSAASLGQALATDPTALLAQMASIAPGARVALFLDRFEAVFALPHVSEVERGALVTALDVLAASPVILVLLACRNDFYPRIAEYPTLMQGKRYGAHVDLAPPTHAEIAQMIRLPALAAKLTFGVDPQSQARLDDVLCQSVTASPDALPLLQYTLQELYRQRSAEGELTVAAFERLGGVDGAIGQRAEEVIAAMSELQRAALPRVLSLVVTVSPTSDLVTSRRAPWSALHDAPEREVVAALVEARLLVSELVGTEAGFGVAHEALLRRWERATEWIAAHQNSLRVRSRIGVLAARWQAEGQPPDLLLPHGKQLEEALELRDVATLSLASDELALIGASHRKARLRERVRLGVGALLLVLTVLAIGLGVTAMGARRVAEQRRADAEGLIEFMLGDFADKLRPLGRLDLLAGVSTKALEYLGGQHDSQARAADLTGRAKALQVIGEVHRARGDSKAAIEALQSANVIFQQQHTRSPTDTNALKNLGVNAYWLGQINRDRNEWDQAAIYWRQYQEFSDRLNQLEPDKVEWWIEQSYGHNNLGALAITRGDATTAAREFLMSIALKKRALEKTPDSVTVAGELADSYSWLASATEALGDIRGAANLYAQEMAIILQLRQSARGDALWIKRETRALHHRAINLAAQGLDVQALADYRAARLLFSDIVGKDRQNRSWQNEIANMEQEERYLIGHGKSDASYIIDMKGIHARLMTMREIDPANTTWALREVIARMRVAEGLLDNDELIEAREQSQLALQNLNAMYAENTSNQYTRLTTVDGLLLSAKIANKMGARSEARISCEKAYAMLKVGMVAQDYHFLDPWVRVNNCLEHFDVAIIAAEQLRNIGYRNTDYLRNR